MESYFSFLLITYFLLLYVFVIASKYYQLSIGVFLIAVAFLLFDFHFCCKTKTIETYTLSFYWRFRPPMMALTSVNKHGGKRENVTFFKLCCVSCVQFSFCVRNT